MTQQQQDKLQELAERITLELNGCFYDNHSHDCCCNVTEKGSIKLATHILEHPEDWFEIVECPNCEGVGTIETEEYLNAPCSDFIIICPLCKGEKQIMKPKSL